MAAANSPAVNPSGEKASTKAALKTARILGLFTSMPPTGVEAHLRWLGELVQGVIADEGGIHTIQIAQESFQDLPEASDDVGKSLQQPAAAEFLGVVHDGLETKHAFAFGIGLQSQFAEMQLEDRQVIRRCLDHGF